MVSSALSDCGGLRNSTVPQVLVLFRLHASSRSGAARIISSSIEFASSTKENRDAKLFVSMVSAYKSHNWSFHHRWLGTAQMQFCLCSGRASTIFRSNHSQPLASCFKLYRDHPPEYPMWMCVLQLECSIICNASVMTSQTSSISLSPPSRLLWIDEIISRPTWWSVSLHHQILFGSSIVLNGRKPLESSASAMLASRSTVHFS